MMRLSLLLAVLILPLTLFGCAVTPQPIDYNALPGSDHMAKGPGLFSRDQKGGYDGGYTLYSTAKQPRKSSSRTRSNAHQQYTAFEAWQRFKRLSRDAPERRAFQQWQKWQRFRHWQKQHR